MLDALFMAQEDFSITDLRDERLWSEFGFLTTETASGILVNPENALALAAYYDGIRIISEDVAKLPFPVYRRLEPRGKERDREHPVHRVLNDSPNRNMSAMSFRETMTANAIGWGGGFAVIRRNGIGQPLELRPIHPSRVRVELSKEGRLFYVVGNDDGTQSTLNQSQVFHLHGLSPDGMNGYSVARIGAESIGRGLSAAAFSASFFRSGSSPKIALKTQQIFESEEALERLRHQWQSRYSGAEGWHRPIVLEAGFEIEKISIPPEDAQLIQTEEFTVLDIARWLRVAPHKLAALERSTHSNIEEQNIDHVIDTLMPWARRWESEVKRKLLVDEPDFFAEHLFAALLRGNSEQRGNFMRELFNIGALSQNDVRELENMNPIEGGDTYYVNSALIRSQDAAAGVRSEDAAAGRIDGNDNRPRQSVDMAKPLNLLAEPLTRCAREGAHILLTATLERSQAKERRAVSRLIERHKDERLSYELKNFYAAHAKLMSDAFALSVRGITAMTGAGCAIEAVEAHVARYVEAVLGSGAKALTTMDTAGSELVEKLAAETGGTE